MDKHKKYIDDKTKLAYKKMKTGQLFEKARAVIVKDKKIAYIKNLVSGSITIPGGGVDEGETIKEAVKREAFEETGFEVEPIAELTANYYDVPMQLGEEKFVSKRVEYIYLCKFLGKKKDMAGLDGEYEGGIEIFFDKPEKLLDCRQSLETVEKVKNYCNNTL